MKFLLVLLLAVTACSSNPRHDPPTAVNYPVHLTWDAVTELTDNAELTDLTGYLVLFGPQSQPRSQNAFVPTTFADLSLPTGLWSFQVLAISLSSGQGLMSKEVTYQLPSVVRVVVVPATELVGNSTAAY